MSEVDPGLEPRPWLEALAEATAELSTTTLELDGCTILGPRESEGDLSGGYIALIGDKCSVQIAVAAGPETCRTIAGRLFEMNAEEAQDLPEGDVADAIGEVVNIVAGGVKSRLAPYEATLQLGLPFVIEGVIESTKRLRTEYLEADLGGGMKVVLVAIVDTRHAANAAA